MEKLVKNVGKILRDKHVCMISNMNRIVKNSYAS